VKRIGIVGSRRRDTYEDLKLVHSAFYDIYNEGDVIISGGCPKGGDRFAELIAKTDNIKIIIHYPDKASLPHPAYKWDYARINFDRNTLIAQDSDVLIACAAADRKGGTEDTIKKFLKMGKTRLILV